MYRVCLVYNYQTNKHFALIFSNMWPGSNVPWMGIIEYVKVDEKFFDSHETFVIAISCSASYIHASSFPSFHFLVAAGTDNLAVFLLNQSLFSNKQVFLIHVDGNQNINLANLANRMNEDTNSNLALLRKDGVSSAAIFGLMHFPQWILVLMRWLLMNFRL